MKSVWFILLCALIGAACAAAMVAICYTDLSQILGIFGWVIAAGTSMFLVISIINAKNYKKSLKNALDTGLKLANKLGEYQFINARLLDERNQLIYMLDSMNKNTPVADSKKKKKIKN